MVSAKKIAQLAKKWQRMAAFGTKETGECGATVVDKGHCVVYTADGRRFEVPLAYLGTAVFTELLQMAEDEFSFASNGQIMLPCDATFKEYAMCLLRARHY